MKVTGMDSEWERRVWEFLGGKPVRCLPDAPDGWRYWRREDGKWLAMPLDADAAIRGDLARPGGSLRAVGCTYDLAQLVFRRLFARTVGLPLSDRPRDEMWWQ